MEGLILIRLGSVWLITKPLTSLNIRTVWIWSEVDFIQTAWIEGNPTKNCCPNFQCPSYMYIKKKWGGFLPLPPGSNGSACFITVTDTFPVSFIFQAVPLGCLLICWKKLKNYLPLLTCIYLHCKYQYSITLYQCIQLFLVFHGSIFIRLASCLIYFTYYNYPLESGINMIL